MIELLKEHTDIWNYLKTSDKPIVIYGMGNGAEKIISTLKEYDTEISDIFASDEFVRGHSFLGYRVKKYSEICEKYDDFNVVLAFASHIPSVIENIKAISRKHPVFAPDVPVAGGGLFTLEYVKKHENCFDFVYEHLADEESKKIYLDIINFKISGKVKYLLNSFSEKNEIYKNILHLNEKEIIADLGAYDGDTIKEFTDYTHGKYEKIYALEPDKKNFKKLIKNTQNLTNITAFNIGAWSCRDTLFFENKSGRNSKLSGKGEPTTVSDIDSLINDRITLLKMDIEGSELKALSGAEGIIKAHKPKLYICAYHRNEDLFSIPMKIWEIEPKYKIFFRHSRYIPAWESNFYCTYCLNENCTEEGNGI